jgi:hypothetical protein
VHGHLDGAGDRDHAGGEPQVARGHRFLTAPDLGARPQQGRRPPGQAGDQLPVAERLTVVQRLLAVQQFPALRRGRRPRGAFRAGAAIARVEGASPQAPGQRVERLAQVEQQRAKIPAGARRGLGQQLWGRVPGGGQRVPDRPLQ